MKERLSLNQTPATRPARGCVAVEQHRGLIASVCQRYLKGADVDDAVQETFVRWLRQGAGQPIESLPAWLARVAQTVCLDMLRRRGADRRRTNGAGVILAADAGPDVLAAQHREAIAKLLPRAVRQLSASEQHLLAERFIANVPLRVTAARLGQSIATVSRRAASTLAKLAGILRDFGVDGSNEDLLGDVLAGDGDVTSSAAERDVFLRTHRDRRRLEQRLRRAFGPDGFHVTLPAAVDGPLWPGWTRPIRVGVSVLYKTILAYGYRGSTVSGEIQAMNSALLADPRFDLVAVVEPRTSHRGPIERTIRDYRLLEGLIEADDVDALATLDVLLLGANFFMTSETMMAIRTAVAEHGVGYLKDGWLHAVPNVKLPDFASELLLARPPVYAYHMPGRCGSMGEGVVTAASPRLRVPVGHRFRVVGCGPAFRPLPGTTVLMERTRVVTEHEHGLRGVGPLPMPLYLTGHLGRGRATVVTNINHALFNREWFSPDYFPNLIAWLAEPRRERDVGHVELPLDAIGA